LKASDCLYTSDYGPPDPGFDPFAGSGMLIRGFEAHTGALGGAQNLGQLEAMKRMIDRGKPIIWCEQGYSWVYDARLELGMVLLAVILLPRWRRPLHRWFVAIRSRLRSSVRTDRAVAQPSGRADMEAKQAPGLPQDNQDQQDTHQEDGRAVDPAKPSADRRTREHCSLPGP
jgi:hypothetical protein